jgi:hypothetical protein
LPEIIKKLPEKCIQDLSQEGTKAHYSGCVN